MSHSILSASTGLSPEAFNAGYTPKTAPINNENPINKAISDKRIGTVIPKMLIPINEIVPPINSPAMLPMSEMTTASVRNSNIIRLLVAPIDFFMPISRILSLTDTSIIVMMPKPETTREMPLITVKTRLTISSSPPSLSLWRERLSARK